MKFAKRLLSLLLVTLMVGVLFACGEQPVTTDGVTGSVDSSETVGGQGSGSGGEDLLPDPIRPTEETEGKTYIVIQHQEPENIFGYLQDSNMGLQAADRVAEVSELYGCTFAFSQVPYNDQFASQLQALQFAENGGDLIFSTNNAQLRKALGTGPDESLCCDLLKLDSIINFWDFNKWGNITSRECMMAGGVFYGVTPALWTECTPLPYYTVVYNKDIVVSAGAVDPQESWEKEEWDVYAMVDVIKTTTNEADGVWGMTASMVHMVRATFLTNGMDLISIEEISSDGSVQWKSNLDSGEAIAAFQWLKNTLTANAKCFNNGKSDWTTWGSHTPFNEEYCAMSLTAPGVLFDSIVIEGPTNFGVITWAGQDANVLTGFYEKVHTVAIPVFAQNPEHSAFLMRDLFEGLGEVETWEDILQYYSDTYFNSDIDLTCLIREGASLQYSYWPNGCDTIWSDLASSLLTSSSVTTLVQKNLHSADAGIETYMVPNKVELERWRQAGKFD